MPNGPFDPRGGLIGRIFTLHPVVRETRVRGKHTVFISEEVGFRTLGATRGCADYMAEFSTYTTFAQGPAKPTEAEEAGEAVEAQFLNCPDPFAMQFGNSGRGPDSPPDYGIEGFDPDPDPARAPSGTPFGDQSFIP